MQSDTALNNLRQYFDMMSDSDNKPESRVFKKSIPLIHECLNERVSITLLLSTLQLIDRGLITEEEELNAFMRKRMELNPKSTYDVEKVKDLILKSYF